MQFFSILAVLAAALPFTCAAPAAEAVAPARFYLKSQVTAGNARFNNLYVSPAHTGAGFNTALMLKKVKNTPKSYLNGTILNFELVGSDDPYRLLLLQPDDFYSSWGACQINIVTAGTKGFAINGDGNLINKNSAAAFGGWRVCQWNHGSPELFHNIEGFGAPNPSSCALVNLVAEYV